MSGNYYNPIQRNDQQKLLQNQQQMTGYNKSVQFLFLI